MLSDLAKQIVERPRRSRIAHRQRRRRRYRARPAAPEMAPKQRSMSSQDQYAWSGKRLKESLGTLTRYLERTIGRPWWTVKSTFCAQVRVDRAVEPHIVQQVEDGVVCNVETLLAPEATIGGLP